MNDSFDVLYDMRFQDYLLKIGKDFQARFVDVSQDVAPAASLLPLVLPEPVAEPSTDPVDVLYRAYFGDVRLEAVMSQGLPKEQWRIATYADEVDTAFRRWLVTPNSNLRRAYHYGALLYQRAPDQAPKLLNEVFGDLKKQLLQHEFYEYIPRLEKGLAKIRQRFGITLSVP
ncbi:hypothetical protein ACO2Q8_01775 [Larkinella sp. VNQ87]|uniref:hypothetical protein n=1 Tax=Larkinella sp. VNQ87 TaxID=3400921 RepID=UPI003C0C8F69